jgi:hypothetical protein
MTPPLQSLALWTNLPTDAERMRFILKLFPDTWEPISVTSLASLATIAYSMGYPVPRTVQGMSKTLEALEQTGAISTRLNTETNQLEVKLNYGSLQNK